MFRPTHTQTQTYETGMYFTCIHEHKCIPLLSVSLSQSKSESLNQSQRINNGVYECGTMCSVASIASPCAALGKRRQLRRRRRPLWRHCPASTSSHHRRAPLRPPLSLTGGHSVWGLKTCRFGEGWAERRAGSQGRRASYPVLARAAEQSLVGREVESR